LNRFARWVLVGIIVVVVLVVLKTFVKGPFDLFMNAPKEIPYSQLLADIKDGSVTRGVIKKDYFEGEYLSAQSGSNSNKFTVRLPDAFGRARMYELAEQKNVKIEVDQSGLNETVIMILMQVILPLLIFVAFWMLFIRPAQNGNNQALNFGKSRARRLADNVPRVTFDDVAGVDEAKQDLQEIVDFLKNAKRYQALGAKIPKGVLLLGPPGSGKTLLARAIAGEAGVPFFHISGSDFVEMFVGVGASRVRDLFDTARQNRPALIFIDEIDAVGRQRGAGWGGGHDEREQTLNQLLVEMDGFDPNAGVILVAATNRPDVLDPALLRPGRFDRRVVVDSPDRKGREAILKIHTKGKPIDTDVRIDDLAKRTPGFSGAELANLVNEAALLAARREKTRIGMDEFEEAIDREIMGPARKSRTYSEALRRRTAYHEAGHAIIGELLEHANPIHKITILPRGQALGLTWNPPAEERYTQTKQEMEDNITVFLGGRVAEIQIFGDNGLDTGAHNDLSRLTDIAKAMVCEYGMSERLGNRQIGKRHGNPFLGRDGAMEERDYSDEIAKIVDEEIRTIIDRNYARANEILKTNAHILERITDALIEKETLDREDFLSLMQDAIPPAVGGRKPEPPGSNNPEPPDNPTATTGEPTSEPRPTPQLRPNPAVRESLPPNIG
jgi:cell division protease FtsH